MKVDIYYGNWNLSFQNVSYVAVLNQQSSLGCTFNTDFLFDNMYWNAVTFTKEIFCHASRVYWIH